MLEQGLITHEAVVDMCMKAMSEDQVDDMLDSNELSERFFEDEDPDPEFLRSIYADPETAE
jgi:hypothetical protein